MTVFDPLTFITPSNTGASNKCEYFGYKFDSMYDPSVWPKLRENFFYAKLKDIIKENGETSVITVGVFGELIRPGCFILTDLKSVQIQVVTNFKTEYDPGTLLLINCPCINHNQSNFIQLTNDKQIFEIGKVLTFGYCEKKGSHMACTKFVDLSKRKLCSFHTAYYRLKAANQLKVQQRYFPTSMPIAAIARAHHRFHHTNIFSTSRNTTVTSGSTNTL